AERAEVLVARADDLAVEGGDRALAVAGEELLVQAVESLGAVERSAGADGRLVENELQDLVRAHRGFEGADRPEGVTEEKDRLCDRVDAGGGGFEITIDLPARGGP